MKFQEHWREYRDKHYPDGMTAGQNRQVHQAFFAGIYIALQETMYATSLSNDDALAALQTMFREADEVCGGFSKGVGRE